MYTEETIDFGKVNAATTTEFLEPGMYRLKVDPKGTRVVTPEGGKTPYLQVRFVSESGASVTEKFFLTAKALPRLQYLHEAWTSKRLDKSFKSMIEVGTYFSTFLTAKIVTRPMITGGKIAANGNFYSGLPYTGFVVTQESLFEEGPFDKDSARYKQVVTVDKPNPAVANTNAALLPEADAFPTSGSTASADDMPW
jgi:hypothetical protein